MATEVRRRRGSEAENNLFKGGEGELSVIIESGGAPTTDVITVVVHDNVVIGGYKLARKDLENVNPPSGRTNLGLGTVATFDQGTAINEIPKNSFSGALESAAYETIGTQNDRVPLLIDSVATPGIGSFPIAPTAISAENLVNFPNIVDRATQTNVTLNTYINLDQNNISTQLMLDGIVDAFVDDNQATSAGGQYNAGAKLFEDIASAPFILTSGNFIAQTQPEAAHIVVIYAKTIVPNTDFVVEVGRDGNAGTFIPVAIVDQGPVLNIGGTTRLITGTVDLSGAPAGTTMVWRITTTGIDVEVHGVGLFWQTPPFVGI